jgi:hypothetical protein
MVSASQDYADREIAGGFRKNFMLKVNNCMHQKGTSCSKLVPTAHNTSQKPSKAKHVYKTL